MNSHSNHEVLSKFSSHCDECSSSLLEYFNTCLKHLNQYSWIHNFKVNNILNHDVVGLIPDVWKKAYLEWPVDQLNALPKGNVTQLPEDLYSFIQVSKSLCLPTRQYSDYIHVETSIPVIKHMTPKKSHEVVEFSSVVAKLCLDYHCNHVIDLGAGLGYVDKILFENYGLSILAIEKEEGFTKSSEKKFSSGIETMNLSLEDSDHCWSLVTSKVSEFCGPNRCGLIGLHCCGDLSTFILKLFERMQAIQFVLCVSCCYHKMTLSPESCSNFPMSKSLYEVSSIYQIDVINLFSLRLACQETPVRWLMQTKVDHEKHSMFVQWGSFVEWIKCKSDLSLSKSKSNIKALFNSLSIEEFIEKFSDYFVISCDGPLNYEELKVLLLKLFSEQAENFKYLELLTALQVIMQPVLESLILLDRVMYLLENGNSSYSVTILPIFNEYLSPRNLGLLALRNNK